MIEIDLKVTQPVNQERYADKSDNYQKSIDNLVIGSWRELTGENSNKLALKLAWKNTYFKKK